MTVAEPIDAAMSRTPDVLHHECGGSPGIRIRPFRRHMFLRLDSQAPTYFKAAANMDAWEHSMHEKCHVAVPLATPGRRTLIASPTESR